MDRIAQYESDRKAIAAAARRGERPDPATADRFRYESLRRTGASHDVAVRKVAMGNWNPYDGEPVPAADRIAQVESTVEGIR